MKLTSPAFEHGGKIPSTYTCDGKNINPPLIISDVPAGTATLTLVMDDPDVPKHLRADGMWDHWIVFNISPRTHTVREGEEPSGAHGVGTGGDVKYQGPCPPDREHRYFFKLYALDIELDVPEKATKQQLEEAMEGHIIEKAELMGRYTRI